jgi:single-strand DNA-binding protein
MLTATAHGRIGRDVELKFHQDQAVAEIALACNYGRKGEDGRQPTQWVRAALWGQQAEKLAQYLTKGKGVVLTLRDVHIREWESNGKAGTSLEGTVIHLEFTGAGPREEQQGQGRAPAPAAAPRPAPRPAPAPQTSGGFDDMDDDIPF